MKTLRDLLNKINSECTGLEVHSWGSSATTAKLSSINDELLKFNLEIEKETYGTGNSITISCVSDKRLISSHNYREDTRIMRKSELCEIKFKRTRNLEYSAWGNTAKFHFAKLVENNFTKENADKDLQELANERLVIYENAIDEHNGKMNQQKDSKSKLKELGFYSVYKDFSISDIEQSLTLVETGKITAKELIELFRKAIVE
jgi:hypothetical protein